MVLLDRHRSAPLSRDRSVILSSWERCQNEHGLEKEAQGRETAIRRERVRDSIEALGPLFSACRSQVQHIFQNIVGSGHAVILTDKTGTIIDFSVQSELEALFRQAGLRRGADWSEDREGTNGIGTAIWEKKSVTIYQDQHFYRNHASLTCTGAPVFDEQGEVLAVFDVSSIGRKDDLEILAHTRALLEMSARLISRRNFQDHFSDHWILRFHRDAERVGLLEEGLLALDHQGRIVGVDEMAVSHLGLGGRSELISTNIEDLFAMQANQLADNLSQAGRVAQELWLSGGNGQGERNLHARLVEPMGQGAGLVNATGRRVRTGGARAAGRTKLPDLPQLPNLAKRRQKSQAQRDRGKVSKTDPLLQLVGGDDHLQALSRKALKLFEHDVPLLVTGETGVGKDSFSRALHETSRRAEQAFIAVNCGALPENLIESELFGYKAGAFTGAQEKGFKGQILAANGGTLLLDEIGDMPLSAQTRLLQVLEQRKVVPLGSSEGVELDIRLIAATHQSLEALCAQGKFREDLYFRLCGFRLDLPPLRARKDLVSLVARLSGGRNLDCLDDFSEQAATMLRDYAWPGNIRQLKHVLKTATILAEEAPICAEHLQMGPMAAQNAAGEASLSVDPVRLPEMTDDLKPLQGHVAEKESETILAHLSACKWNVSRAARSLGLSRNTLYRKMKAYDIARH